MKLFKKRNIQALIYGLFMLLPFCAILARVIYVQSNKNAYESYYGETINERKKIDIDYLNLETNKEYYFENVITSNKTDAYGNNTYLLVSNVKNLNGFNNDIDLSSVTRIRLYLTNQYIALDFRNGNDTQVTTYQLEVLSGNFSFTYLGYTGNQTALSYYNYFYTLEYNKYSYLDNVFEYSIDRFVDENNFGNFDFFQWFSTFFLQDNAVNNLYVHFINWYMNYMLFVSLGYLIFSILMWFVNFFRSLVEKSTDLNL